MAGRTGALTPLLYTAQDVARYCEVDLKTIHHWADAGKIPHYRTEGRHLRFRRNDIVRFLRQHGYPLPDELTMAKPTLFFATPLDDDHAKKLGARFSVRRFPHVLAAVAQLASCEPDVVVCALEDETWNGLTSLRALRAEAPWTTLVVVGEVMDEAIDLALTDVGKLGTELVRILALT